MTERGHETKRGRDTERSRGIETSVDIEAPIDVVFAAITDFAGAAERISKIEKVEMLSDGPVGVGTRFKETRIMFGRQATETMEVASFDPPNGYELTAGNHGCRYLSGLRCEDLGAGRTRLTMHFQAVPETFIAKVMIFLTRPLLKKVAKMCGEDLQDIKRSVESGS